MIKLIPLSGNYLTQAQELFPRECAGKMLAASLNIEQSRDYLGSIDVLWLEYDLAVDDEGNVVGTTGLYTQPAEEGVVWLGWYCTDENHRKQGIGTKLLKNSLDKAKAGGYSTVKIYSSAGPEGEAASKLYQSHGLSKRVGITGIFTGKKDWSKNFSSSADKNCENVVVNS